MKLNRVKDLLINNKLDALFLFQQSPSFRYFLGYPASHGIMVLLRNRKLLLTSALYKPKAKGFVALPASDYAKLVISVKKKHGIKSVGVDEAQLLLRQKKFLSRHFKIKGVSKELEELRVQKTPEEIRRIRYACRVTDEIFSEVIHNIKVFKSERDVERFIRIALVKRDCEPAFDPIVASGRNASVAHHTPGNALNKGFLVLDFGAKYKGYCSDMTRTIYLGEPTKREASAYKKVLAAEEACIEKARIGLKCSELHNTAVEALGADAKYFIHATGHGFGVEIHENPKVSSKSKDVLRKNTVIAIEPGYYNQKTGIGIRIEDDIYLGSRIEVLTRSSKRLICINK